MRKVLENGIKKQREFIMINNENMCDELIDETIRKYKKSTSTKQANFSGNKLQDMSKIFSLFPCLEIAIFSIFFVT